MSIEPIYLHEKLVAARRALMLPHPQGEEQSIANAMHECSLGLGNAQPADFEETATGWVRTIRGVLDTRGLDDPHGEGTYMAKARQLTSDQRAAFSDAVDQLAWWAGVKTDELLGR